MPVAALRMKEGAGHGQRHEPVDHERENSSPEANPDEIHPRSLTLNLLPNLRNMAVTRGLSPFHDPDLLLRPRVGAQRRANRVDPQRADIGAWEKNV